MQALTQRQIEKAGELVDEIETLVETLEAANKIRFSGTRQQFIRTLTGMLAAIDESVSNSDGPVIADIDVDVEHMVSLIATCHDAALAEWPSQYAVFLDGVRWLVDPETADRPDGPTKMLALTLARAWKQQRDKTSAEIPARVREVYAFHLVANVDGFLGIGARKFGQVRDFNVLNTDDVPLMFLQAWSFSGHAADLAIAAWRRERSLAAAAKQAEDDEPGIIATVWGIVGWDSFADFAFDMGLLVVTGGGSSFFRWGKKVAQGVKGAKRIRESKRLLSAAEAFEKHVRMLEEAQELIRKRLKVAGRAESKTLKASEEFIRKRVLRLLKLIREYADAAVEGTQAKDNLIDAFKQAWKLSSTIGDSLAAERLLRLVHSTGVVDLTAKSFEEIAAGDIAEAAAKLGLGGIGDIDKRIVDAEDATIHAISFGGRTRKLYLKWFFLLITRQIAVRTLVLAARKRSKIRAVDDIVAILFKSMTASIEEILIALKVPKSFTGELIKHVMKIMRKFVSSLTSTIATELVTLARSP